MATPKLEVVAVGEFKIEKGVQYSRQAMAKRKYPFDQMEIGDSFAIPIEKQAAVQNASWQFGKIHGRKYSVRKTPDGYRCWRVA